MNGNATFCVEAPCGRSGFGKEFRVDCFKFGKSIRRMFRCYGREVEDVWVWSSGEKSGLWFIPYHTPGHSEGLELRFPGPSAPQ